MNEQLKYLFANVNDWLKFIEAKNTALIALNGAAALGLTQVVNNSIKNEIVNYFIIYWLIPLLVLSLITSLVAITTFAHKLSGYSYVKRLRSKNLLYYGYISSLTIAVFTAKLRHSQFYYNNGSPYTLTKADYLLINQIHTNSKIAFGKNRLFQYALFLSIFAVVSSYVIIQTLRWSDEVKVKASKVFDFNSLKDEEPKKKEAPTKIETKDFDVTIHF